MILYVLKTFLYLLLILTIALAVSGGLLALHYLDQLRASGDPAAWLRKHTDLWLIPNLSSVIIPVSLWFLVAVAYQAARLNNACIVGTGLFVGLFCALFIPSALLPWQPLYYYLIVPVAVATAYLIWLANIAIFYKRT